MYSVIFFLERIFDEIDWIIYFKWMQFIAYQLYLNIDF